MEIIGYRCKMDDVCCRRLSSLKCAVDSILIV